MNRLSGRWSGRVARGLVVAVVLGCSGGEPESAAPAPAPAEPARPAGPVLFIGVDGAAWSVIERLVDAGELPAFARLLAEGAHAPAFAVVSPQSPVAWTSVATGRAPADHGIVDYTTALPGGERIPVTGNQRRAHAIWEIADRHALSSGVLGWWASWPAEPVRGYVVTDHAVPAAMEFLLEDGRYFTADSERLAALGRDFQPPAIAELLAASWVGRDEASDDATMACAGLTAEQTALLAAAPWNRREPYSIAKSYHRVDLSLVRAAERLMAERPTDLTMIYLRGPDPVQHYAWDLVEPEKYEVPPVDLERDRGLVEGVYRCADALVGRVMAAAAPDGWTIVASDHGAEPSPGATGPQRRTRPGGHGPDAHGIAFIHGPHVRAGFVLDAASPYDLLPTMHWLLGLPLAADLEGEPLLAAFEEDFVRQRARIETPSWGARETSAPLASPADDAMLEDLRSLGYLD